jgi:formate transporter
LLIKEWGPAALWLQAGDSLRYDALTWSAFLLSLVPVTIGNIVGGGGLVGAVYWFIYLRPGRRRL